MRAVWVEGDAVHETGDLDEARRVYESGTRIWIDLGPQTPETTAFLADTFKLHPLVLEDIWSERALPKIEDFDDYLFILVHGVHTASSTRELSLVELDIVVGKNFVITHHHEESCAIDAVKESTMRSAKVLKKGPAWILHEVLDHLVDHYMPILDQFDTDIERLQDDVIQKAGTPHGNAVMTELLTFKRTLQALRRISIYQRELLLRLSRGEFDEIPKEAMPFFRDVYDHFARVTDLADSYRELVGSALEAYLSVQSNRMNEIMKTLTLMSTVMLPITFIAGLYGMNFKHMPELEWYYGYPMALGLMGVVATGIIAWFRHKRWL